MKRILCYALSWLFWAISFSFCFRRYTRPAKTTLVPTRRSTMLFIEIFCEPRFTRLMTDGSRLTPEVFFDAMTLSPKLRFNDRDEYGDDTLWIIEGRGWYAKRRTIRLISRMEWNLLCFSNRVDCVYRLWGMDWKCCSTEGTSNITSLSFLSVVFSHDILSYFTVSLHP